MDNMPKGHTVADMAKDYHDAVLGSKELHDGKPVDLIVGAS